MIRYGSCSSDWVVVSVASPSGPTPTAKTCPIVFWFTAMRIMTSESLRDLLMVAREPGLGTSVFQQKAHSLIFARAFQ
jgi:hypothetical protein